MSTAPSLASTGLTIQGQPVRLPLEVRDAKSMFATFLIPAGSARRLVPAAGIELAEPLPGRTFVSIAAIEYIDNDLGRYNEVAVAFPVIVGTRRSWPLLGAALDFASGRGGVYIHQLPVTTAFSCAAGREIWGFPKIVADIAIEDTGDRRRARLTVDGTHALTLTVKRSGRGTFRGRPLDAIAVRDGIAWRTRFHSSGEGTGLRLGGATLELGRHAIGTELAALGLPKRPLLSGWIERLSARFEAPALIGA